MQFIVQYRGVALGTVEIAHAGLTGGTLRVEVGYSAVRAVVHDATLATANYGFLGPVDNARSGSRGTERIEAHRALLDALELRSATDGTLIPCEFLDLTEGADEQAPPIIFLSLDESLGLSPAVLESPKPSDPTSAFRPDV